MSRKINWTPEIDKFIKDNYKHKTDAEIGKILGYKESSIVVRRSRLGLEKGSKIEGLRELEKYNLRLKKLKQSIKINDQVEVAGGRIRQVVEKYPNFVVCMVNGFREAVLYIDIRRIV